MAKQKKNIWKIISIICIVIFVLVLIGGLLKAYRFRNTETKPTDSQINIAKNIAQNDLNARGEDTTGFVFRPSEMIRNINPGEGSKNVLEVSFYNQTSKYLYIIDIYSGKILVYSKTEYNDGLNHTNEVERVPPPIRIIP